MQKKKKFACDESANVVYNIFYYYTFIKWKKNFENFNTFPVLGLALFPNFHFPRLGFYLPNTLFVGVIYE